MAVTTTQTPTESPDIRSLWSACKGRICAGTMIAGGAAVSGSFGFVEANQGYATGLVVANFGLAALQCVAAVACISSLRHTLKKFAAPVKACANPTNG